MEDDTTKKPTSKRLQNAQAKAEEEEKKQAVKEKGLTWKEDGKIFLNQL